jgi:hypothetical protein
MSHFSALCTYICHAACLYIRFLAVETTYQVGYVQLHTNSFTENDDMLRDKDVQR